TAHLSARRGSAADLTVGAVHAFYGGRRARVDKLVMTHYLNAMSQAGRVRMSADERREQVLEVALGEFAASGLAGTSTEDVAEKAGISQPYLFRLFPTKKSLFLALVQRCFKRVED